MASVIQQSISTDTSPVSQGMGILQLPLKILLTPGGRGDHQTPVFGQEKDRHAPWNPSPLQKHSHSIQLLDTESDESVGFTARGCSDGHRRRQLSRGINFVRRTTMLR
ncbi:UNVERIFIED_CONTAM: hypothetical protein K2H54_008450 [Gekko kuhli]